MMRRRAGGAAGITLVEVLVAMAVAAIALGACPGFLVVIGRAAVLAREGTAAVALAQAKLEELAGGPDVPGAGGDAPAPGATPAAFARTWRIEAVAPRREIRRIAVAVRWAGGAHEVVLETLAWRP
jgi:Tfp pilus assembly protein PilV